MPESSNQSISAPTSHNAEPTLSNQNSTSRADKLIVAALAEELSRTLSIDLPVSAIEEISSGTPGLIDATRKFYYPARGHKGPKSGFILLSGPGNPQLVRRAVANIAAVRENLAPRLKAPVLPPIATGEVYGATYAVWPWRRPLSSKRLGFAIQKRLLASSLYDWLYNVAQASSSLPESDQSLLTGFIDPLRFIMRHNRLPVSVREKAENSLNRISTNVWKPYLCIQHTDLWIGNILLGKNGAGADDARFYVIDWAGAKIAGYPFEDLAKLMRSIGANRKTRQREFDRHRALFNCQREDVFGYVLAALGCLGQNLEHFPEEKYLQLCAETFDCVESYAEPDVAGKT